MSLSVFAGIGALALLQGALVALPKTNALERLVRLRSPAWAAILPGSIVIGTFVVRALPPAATGLVILAEIGTPLLCGVAALSVMRGPRAAKLTLILTLLVLVTVTRGEAGELSASVITALGCSTLGMGLVRVIPRQYMMISVLSMCVIDVTLLLIGAGQPAAALMTQAEAHVPRPTFDDATIGNISIDYPDLVLAGVLGGAVAGRKTQPRAAIVVTTLAAAYGMFLPFVSALPATVPPAFVFILLCKTEQGTLRLRFTGSESPRRVMTLRSISDEMRRAHRAGASPARSGRTASGKVTEP
jgi:hypothetical protein